jgi:hypothetical protein
LKRVYGSYNQTAVYHARNLLEAEGIDTLVRNAALSSAMGELPPAECQAELWVIDDGELAQRVLAAQPACGPDWICACGEALAPQFTHCWRCGSARQAGEGADQHRTGQHRDP